MKGFKSFNMAKAAPRDIVSSLTIFLINQITVEQVEYQNVISDFLECKLV